MGVLIKFVFIFRGGGVVFGAMGKSGIKKETKGVTGSSNALSSNSAPSGGAQGLSSVASTIMAKSTESGSAFPALAPTDGVTSPPTYIYGSNIPKGAWQALNNYRLPSGSGASTKGDITKILIEAKTLLASSDWKEEMKGLQNILSIAMDFLSASQGSSMLSVDVGEHLNEVNSLISSYVTSRRTTLSREACIIMSIVFLVHSKLQILTNGMASLISSVLNSAISLLKSMNSGVFSESSAVFLIQSIIITFPPKNIVQVLLENISAPNISGIVKAHFINLLILLLDCQLQTVSSKGGGLQPLAYIPAYSRINEILNMLISNVHNPVTNVRQIARLGLVYVTGHRSLWTAIDDIPEECTEEYKTSFSRLTEKQIKGINEDIQIGNVLQYGELVAGVVADLPIELQPDFSASLTYNHTQKGNEALNPSPKYSSAPSKKMNQKNISINTGSTTAREMRYTSGQNVARDYEKPKSAKGSMKDKKGIGSYSYGRYSKEDDLVEKRKYDNFESDDDYKHQKRGYNNRYDLNSDSNDGNSSSMESYTQKKGNQKTQKTHTNTETGIKHYYNGGQEGSLALHTLAALDPLAATKQKSNNQNISGLALIASYINMAANSMISSNYGKSESVIENINMASDAIERFNGTPSKTDDANLTNITRDLIKLCSSQETSVLVNSINLLNAVVSKWTEFFEQQQILNEIIKVLLNTYSSKVVAVCKTSYSVLMDIAEYLNSNNSLEAIMPHVLSDNSVLLCGSLKFLRCAISGCDHSHLSSYSGELMPQLLKLISNPLSDIRKEAYYIIAKLYKALENSMSSYIDLLSSNQLKLFKIILANSP